MLTLFNETIIFHTAVSPVYRIYLLYAANFVSSSAIKTPTRRRNLVTVTKNAKWQYSTVNLSFKPSATSRDVHKTKEGNRNEVNTDTSPGFWGTYKMDVNSIQTPLSVSVYCNLEQRYETH